MVHVAGDSGFIAWTNSVDTQLAAASATYVAKAGDVVAAPLNYTGSHNTLLVTNDATFGNGSFGDALGAASEGAFLKLNPPAPPAASNGSGGQARNTVVQVQGTPVDTANHVLFVDGHLVRVQVKSYDDHSVTSFASVTGTETDVCIDGSGNNVQALAANYAVPIVGGVAAASGTINRLYLFHSDTLQGSATAPGLTINDLQGAHFARPYRTGANITVGSQLSLFADIGQRFQTDASGGVDHTMGLYDAGSGLAKYLRVNGSTLEIVNNAFSARILHLSDTGNLSASKSMRPSGGEAATAGVAIWSAATIAALPTSGPATGDIGITVDRNIVFFDGAAWTLSQVWPGATGGSTSLGSDAALSSGTSNTLVATASLAPGTYQINGVANILAPASGGTTTLALTVASGTATGLTAAENIFGANQQRSQALAARVTVTATAVINLVAYPSVASFTAKVNTNVGAFAGATQVSWTKDS